METHHAKGPENAVEDDKPCLLAESGEVLALVPRTAGFRKRREHVLHSRSAETSEKDNAECDEVVVIEANAVHACCGVVVAEVEEFRGVDAGLGDEGMREEEQGEEVE